MHQPIRCLQSLLYQLSVHASSKDTLAVLKRYEGFDWKNLEAYQPMTLFQTKDTEVNLLYWKKGKNMIYYNDQTTHHIKVLNGSFDVCEMVGRRVRDYYAKKSTHVMCPISHAMSPPVTSHHTRLITNQTHTCFPFSRITMIAKEPSATLQVITRW